MKRSTESTLQTVQYYDPCTEIISHSLGKLAATLRDSRPGVQSALLIMTSLMT